MARIVVALVWLLSEDVHRAAEAALLPEALRAYPLGTAWASPLVTPAVATLAYVVTVAAAAFALVGFRTRSSLSALGVGGVILLGLGQLRGPVLHDHHLVWLAALLAASPAGDALSIDAWLSARRGRTLASRPSARYGLPLRLAWVVVGLVYFFPGLHKLEASGVAWALSDNVRNQMWLKWAEMDGAFEPLARIDRHPMLCRAGGLAVLALELGFLPMVLAHRWTRWAAVAAAFAFHQATALFLAIRYETLWVCLAIFLPWWERSSTSAERDALEPPSGAVLVIGGALIAGVAITGALGVQQAWPFACYPTFERIADDRLPDLGMEIVGSDGRAREAPRELVLRERGQARYRRVIAILDDPSRARLDALLDDAMPRLAGAQLLSGARAVRMVRLVRSADPERRRDPPLARSVLYERPARAASAAVERIGIPRVRSGRSTLRSSDVTASAR